MKLGSKLLRIQGTLRSVWKDQDVGSAVGIILEKKRLTLLLNANINMTESFVDIEVVHPTHFHVD